MNKSKKVFILDTNVLIFDPKSIFSFDEHDIVIPDIVIEELDSHKSEQTERGFNIRTVTKLLIDIMEKNKNSKFFSKEINATGFPLGEGKGNLFIVESNTLTNTKNIFSSKKTDNVLLNLTQIENSVLITRDKILRAKAISCDIPSEDYKNGQVENDKEYLGRRIVFVSQKAKKDFINNGFLALEHITDENKEKITDLVVNEFIEMYDMETKNDLELYGRYDGDKIVKLRYEKATPMGIIPKNAGQIFILEALLSPEAPLVIIKGPAGTAKTFLTLAVALEKIKEKNKGQNNIYRNIMICRPNVCMDEEIGFLKGSENEKIEPFMRGIKDNILSIYESDGRKYGDKENRDKMEALFDEGIIKTEALAFQRGRSLRNHYIILDEMQNSTYRQAKCMATRLGEDSKMILLGDPDQIDTPYLDRKTNGLRYISEKMKDPLCYQITMKDEECERSALAKRASELLK